MEEGQREIKTAQTDKNIIRGCLIVFRLAWVHAGVNQLSVMGVLAPAPKSLISAQLCFIALLGFPDSETAAVIVFFLGLM